MNRIFSLFFLTFSISAFGQVEWINLPVDQNCEIGFPHQPQRVYESLYTGAFAETDGVRVIYMKYPYNERAAITNEEDLRQFYAATFQGTMQSFDGQLGEVQFKYERDILLATSDYTMGQPVTNNCIARFMFVKGNLYIFSACAPPENSELRNVSEKFFKSLTINNDLQPEDQFFSPAEIEEEDTSIPYQVGQIFPIVVIVLFLSWLIFYIVILAGPGLDRTQATYRIFSIVKWSTCGALWLSSLGLLFGSIILKNEDVDGQSLLGFGIAGIVCGGIGILIAILKPRMRVLMLLFFSYPVFAQGQPHTLGDGVRITFPNPPVIEETSRSTMTSIDFLDTRLAVSASKALRSVRNEEQLHALYREYADVRIKKSKDVVDVKNFKEEKVRDLILYRGEFVYAPGSTYAGEFRILIIKGRVYLIQAFSKDSNPLSTQVKQEFLSSLDIDPQLTGQDQFTKNTAADITALLFIIVLITFVSLWFFGYIFLLVATRKSAAPRWALVTFSVIRWSTAVLCIFLFGGMLYTWLAATPDKRDIITVVIGVICGLLGIATAVLRPPSPGKTVL